MGPTGRLVPGSTTGARYKYTVVATPTAANGGTITVSSTGTVNGVSETIKTTFRPKGFLDFIYMTEKENQSPLYSGATDSRCSLRWWQGRSATSGCGEIGFAAGDTIDGPMHTNDTPLLNAQGVNFKGVAETSTMTSSGTVKCTGTGCYRNSTSTWPSSYPYNTTTFPYKDSATPPKVGAPIYAPLLSIPASNTALQAEATATGCVFSGATHIKFVGTQMEVYSPYTTGKACANSGQTSCGTARATASTAVPTPVTVPIPNGVIYVKTYTGSTACNQNAQFASGYPKRNSTGTTVTERGYTSTGARDTSVSGYRYTPDYACGLGTAYIKGVVDGQVTVGTSQDIIVTGNLTMQADPWTVPSSNDVLGLIPTHTVWVYHPVSTASTPVNMGTPVTRIDAAILTVQDSFFVQNYQLGAKLGDLTVVGAISQNHRGTVGTGGSGGTGYMKDYRYDNRFKSGYIKPPAFLAPTSTQWTYGQVTEG